MEILTSRGHWAFGTLWLFATLAIVVGFSGVGGLTFAPFLLLIVPFVGIRFAARRSSETTSAAISIAWSALSTIVEISMAVVFFYLYNLAVLSYCPAPK